MKILIFGATGMVGQGVLRECLRDPRVKMAVVIGRTHTDKTDPKLREILHEDMGNYAEIEPELTGFDACLFCLGVSSSGMSEADYARITFTWTMAAAETLSRLNPGMTFVYVSGAGTDDSERGRVMWARVKGRTENALRRLPLSVYLFRPGFIEPMDGIKSKTPSYRILYAILRPLMPLLRWAMPGQVTSTREVGRAMVAVARHGYRKRTLETRDIRDAASH